METKMYMKDLQALEMINMCAIIILIIFNNNNFFKE